RKRASPSVAKMAATVRPSRRSTSRSKSWKAQPSREARSRPTVDLPLPMKPTRSTCWRGGPGRASALAIPPVEEVREVPVEVPAHLGQGVPAELLEERVGQHERGHRLAHHRRRRHRAYVTPLDGRVAD